MARAKATTKRTEYKVANHTMADIVIPRQSGKSFSMKAAKPLMLPAGQAVTVEAEEWNIWRANPGVKNYIDAGLISEVLKEGPVGIVAERTSNPTIPEHLQTEEETGKNTEIVVRSRRKTASKITIGG